MASLLFFLKKKEDDKFGANESGNFHLQTPPKGGQNDKPNILLRPCLDVEFFLDFAIVAFLFVCDKYYLIID